MRKPGETNEKRKKAAAGSGAGLFSRLFGGGGSSSSSPSLNAGSSPSASSSSVASVKKVKTPKLDPNCGIIAMGELNNHSALATGEPAYCEGCRVILSSVSKLVEEDEGEYRWTCEFCKHVNKELMLEKEEIPKSPCVDYLLAPASGGSKPNEEGMMLFCIDVSGSMCVSTEVPQLQAEWKNVQGGKSKGASAKKGLEMAGVEVEGDQYLPGQSRGASYISRMECMQLAVTTHLRRLKVKHPNQRVMVLTFSSDVVVYGDGTGTPETLAGDMLGDCKALMDHGKKITAAKKYKPVSEVADTLVKAVEEFSEGGATALGPCLAVALGMCSDVEGSEIVLCTDGKANVGVGGSEDDEERNKSFFEAFGKEAQGRKISVSIISIQTIVVDKNGVRQVVKEESSECGLANLKCVAEMTGGTVQVLHPLELVRQIRKISQNPVVATDVQVTVIVHPTMELDRSTSKAALSRAVIPVGNAHQETDISFSFSRRLKYRKSSKSSKSSRQPIQIQISFTSTDGAKYMRVISLKKHVTEDRKVAETNLDASVVSICNVHAAANMLENGDIVGARLRLRAAHELLKRCGMSDTQCEEIAEFVEKTKELDNELKSILLREKARGRLCADGKLKKSNKKGKGKDEAENLLSDHTVEIMQKAKAANQAQYLSGERKKDMCLKRKGDKELNSQYYAYKFS